MDRSSLKEFLDSKALQYEHSDFVEEDPILIPRQFKAKEDQEIAGFFAALFAWGQRTTIINKCNDLLERMGNEPAEFVRHHRPTDLKSIRGFVHRTFNADDTSFFLRRLQQIYLDEGGLEAFVARHFQDRRTTAEAISSFRAAFFGSDCPQRTYRHIGDPLRGSTAKRMNMYLRWMTRPSTRGVDLGLWNDISPSVLSIPLDVHTAGTARRLGLLERKANDQKAVQELDSHLRDFCPEDPVRYDFALFGLGRYEGFSKS